MREGCFAGNWCQFNPALRSTWPVLTVREARWSLDDEGEFTLPTRRRKHARTHAHKRARHGHVLASPPPGGGGGRAAQTPGMRGGERPLGKYN